MRKTILANLIGLIFPAVGAGNTPNIPDNGSMPDQIGLVNAILGMNPFQETGYNAATNTAAFTLTAQQIAGAAQNFLNLTGTLTAAANAQLPTVASLIAALPQVVQSAPTGISFQLRVINSSSGAFAWTLTTNTGWTLGGTQSIAQNTWRDFIITITSATTATIQSVGTGTQS
ncbi:hypothetical protein [Paraburkholderia tropica]|uniref:Uncharacterized protein n=1 Tax=Paraburkholderia tropica TaxID=92647 RepID=A0AAQ1JW01_9BURK|nr:hypothetical protein [Paraburkholderia tropica]RQN37362.1 hypothetical protein EHZ25_18545 [Paraburkholderia tropica]SEK02592.1 hypothetical protein SAMN05216550_113190 [Paraburkholderia tropica]